VITFIAIFGTTVTVLVVAGMILLVPPRTMRVRRAREERSEGQGAELAPRDRAG
jgi:hypothetical protein